MHLAMDINVEMYSMAISHAVMQCRFEWDFNMENSNSSCCSLCGSNFSHIRYTNRQHLLTLYTFRPWIFLVRVFKKFCLAVDTSSGVWVWLISLSIFLIRLTLSVPFRKTSKHFSSKEISESSDLTFSCELDVPDIIVTRIIQITWY